MSTPENYHDTLLHLIQMALLSPGLLPPNEFNLARYSLNAQTRNRLLDPDIGALEDYLIDHSALPGTDSNYDLLHAFGDTVLRLCTSEDMPLQAGYQRLSWLLAWLNQHHPPSFFGEDPDSPLQMLQMASALGFGEWAACYNQIEGGFMTLVGLANSPLWRVQEAARLGLRRLLRGQWDSTLRRITHHTLLANPQEWSLIIGALATPSLLERQPWRVLDALQMMEGGLRYIVRQQVRQEQKSLSELERLLREAMGVLRTIDTERLSAYQQAWLTWPHEGVQRIVWGAAEA